MIHRRTRAALFAALAAMAVAVTGAPLGSPAGAALAAHAPDRRDDEGGTTSLRKELDAASRGWLDAKAALDHSTERQRKLTDQLTEVEADLDKRNRNVGRIVDRAYRNGRLGPVSALLNSTSPEGFLDRAAALSAVTANEEKELRGLYQTRDQVTRSKAAIEHEVREQRNQLAVMEQRKNQAERALEVAIAAEEKAEAEAQAEAERAAAASSGGSSTSGSSDSGSSSSGSSSAAATPAPRNANGSWPAESCSVDDPTTSGCITPRTLHALNQAKAAGFTRYVSCFRNGSSGEHPKGRACDFAAQANGFGGVATGGDKTYGDNLANYFINNADQLGVLYVIWYKRIWLPSSGWKAYSGAGGDPSSDHTNHVHLSVY
ncbi:coiled-coil domain-containing protein [Solwaraspora sp. WMMB335]|uniref:coiled-coil domain-containing protein n=1 Tax=Solwaraspora sp. WMMB335 TaxID=3404118 RepID=UPI003B94F038